MADRNDKKNHLTTTQAAQLLSVSPDTVLKWARAGKIESHRTIGGHFRIPRVALERYNAQLRADQSQTLPIAQPAAHQYCWEFMAEGEAVHPDCLECLTYRSRSMRCYELRDLPDGFGCLRVHCESTCDDCEYYRLVSGQAINVDGGAVFS